MVHGIILHIVHYANFSTGREEVIMKATQELMNEHRGIELMLDILETVASKLKAGERVDTAHLEGIMEFFTGFADKCHHGKEEDLLFPSLEALGIARDGGPIGVMLHEHRIGRECIARMKKGLASMKEGLADGSALFTDAAEEYIGMLRQHIQKEDNVLYPMGDARMSEETDKELFEAFEKLEEERIGKGKHEEFHAFLEKLEGIYLK